MKNIVKPSYSLQEYEMEKAQTFEEGGHEESCEQRSG